MTKRRILSDTLLPIIIILSAVVLSCTLVAYGLMALLDDSQEKFEGACDYLGGKVYVMDFDHRVCIKDGEVVLRDE